MLGDRPQRAPRPDARRALLGALAALLWAAGCDLILPYSSEPGALDGPVPRGDARSDARADLDAAPPGDAAPGDGPVGPKDAPRADVPSPDATGDAAVDAALPDAAPPLQWKVTSLPGFSYLNAPEGVAVDPSTDKLIIADTANHLIRSFDGTTLSVVPMGGATLKYPTGVAVDQAGAIFVADRTNNLVRKILGGVTTTVAGSTTTAFNTACQDWPALDVSLSLPADVEIVPRIAAGTPSRVVIADYLRSAVRELDKGTVKCLGGGAAGYQNGAATTAKFKYPRGLAVELNGAGAPVVYVSDTLNAVIRKIEGGMVDHYAGMPQAPGHADGPLTTAQLNVPRGLALDDNGTLYVADSQNHVIRMIKGGQVYTIAGMPGSAGMVEGRGSSARFRDPRDVAVGYDSSGGVQLYVADTGNNRIRLVEP